MEALLHQFKNDYRFNGFKKNRIPYKVMVVDDSAFIRKTLTRILSSVGYQVITEARNGEEAVTEFIKHKPEIVTMDITMPVMDGISAVEKILTKDTTACVVMVSAMGHHDMVKKAVVKGAKSFVVKPVTEENLDNFLTVIKSVASGSSAAQASAKSAKMVPEYATVFFDASFNAIEKIMGEGTVKKAEINYQRTSNATSSGLSVIVGVTGSLKGHLLIDLSENTALKVAKSMNLQEFQDLNELVMSSLGEIGNMIASGAVMDLNPLGYRLNVTTPIVFFGNPMAMSTLSLTTVQTLPIKTSAGTVAIKLALMRTAGD
jgi:two-component system, chemotaxis family, chemotaxis protein CheY